MYKYQKYDIVKIEDGRLCYVESVSPYGGMYRLIDTSNITLIREEDEITLATQAECDIVGATPESIKKHDLKLQKERLKTTKREFK